MRPLSAREKTTGEVPAPSDESELLVVGARVPNESLHAPGLAVA
ncbi:Hypothetical protein CAP_2059 [Chondromyces apiculatus DSM 436]|uniref:Uncharacterized protein n=1 Tax=Chondromyces apiculatus DSM 436 TaxID=1192034 RepID=A0A017SUK2_9BACT|nr:Hypothetical protein CAP_2059 [Chondromyces apiculatus DSM 436]